MIPQKRYQLNEYQISKMADGRLWWTSHAGFAVQIGGPCYIYGNVLLMGDRHDEENGFMKSEFLDYLKNLPLWDGTRYYCFSSAIMDTATGWSPRRRKITAIDSHAYCTRFRRHRRWKG